MRLETGTVVSCFGHGCETRLVGTELEPRLGLAPPRPVVRKPLRVRPQVVDKRLVVAGDGVDDLGPVLGDIAGDFDCLGLAVKPGFRFEDNPQAVHFCDNVHPPAPAALFEVRRHSLLVKKKSQCAVLEVLLLIHPARLRTGSATPPEVG